MPYADINERREYNRRYKESRREKLSAQQRLYYQRNRGRILEKQGDYLQKVVAEEAPWYKAVTFANNSNRRAKAFKVEGHLFGKDVKKFDGPCFYCGGEATVWDHKRPLSRGGPNTLANIVPSCDTCNRTKARRTPDEWKLGIVIPPSLIRHQT